jgi:hypothetical protein
MIRRLIFGCAVGVVLLPADAGAHHSSSFVGGLLGGALAGAVISDVAREHHHDHYYYVAPAPVYQAPPPRPVPGVVYRPGYCGAPPYPPCRTPVPY